MPNTTVPADGEAMPTATAFLAVTPTMRRRLAATCEALIALLDEIDGDENLEETADNEPHLGWPNAGQPAVAAMSSDDDREADSADYESSHDEEHQLGWQNEGSQSSLHSSPDDREDDAGDDREVENEHFDEGYYDSDLSIPGGGSVSQSEDGWQPDPNDVPPVKKKRGRQKQSAGRKGEVLFRRDDPVTPPRYMTSDFWTHNLPPEANEVLIPHIDLRRVGK